jgi:hypothetical protein
MKKTFLFLLFIFHFFLAFADKDMIIREVVKSGNTSIDSISFEYDRNRMQINNWVELYKKEKKVNVYNLFYPLLRGDSIFLYKIRVRVPKYLKYKYTKLSDNNDIQFHFGNKDEVFIISVRQGTIEGFERNKYFYSNIASEGFSQKRIRLLYFFQEAISSEYNYFIGNDRELIYFVKHLRDRKSEKRDRLIQSVFCTERVDVRIKLVSGGTL